MYANDCEAGPSSSKSSSGDAGAVSSLKRSASGTSVDDSQLSHPSAIRMLQRMTRNGVKYGVTLHDEALKCKLGHTASWPGAQAMKSPHRLANGNVSADGAGPSNVPAQLRHQHSAPAASPSPRPKQQNQQSYNDGGENQVVEGGVSMMDAIVMPAASGAKTPTSINRQLPPRSPASPSPFAAMLSGAAGAPDSASKRTRRSLSREFR